MKIRTWIWVITANFGEGLPYAIINTLLVALMADLKMPPSWITTATGLLALPWAFKAAWSPFIDNHATKRRWMLWMQALLGIAFLGVAGSLSLSGTEASGSISGTTISILFFSGLAAFLSASYDIACDGHYMLALPSDDQSFFVGIRSTAYRLGLLLATGGLGALCGAFEHRLGYSLIHSWQLTFLLIAGMMLGLALLHTRLLPHAERERNLAPLLSYWDTVRSFFTSHKGRDLVFLILFLFFYRLGEAFLSKVTILFLKGTPADGGLGLDNEQYGILYGTLGTLALILGGILGGFAIARYGLRRCIIPMAILLNVPDLLYVWLASSVDSASMAGTDSVLPVPLSIIGTCITIEQFGYGFGFSAYTVYMLRQAKGQYATAHYAFLTALMAIGMTIPSILSGWLLKHLGYLDFFWFACFATLPGFILVAMIARGKGKIE